MDLENLRGQLPDAHTYLQEERAYFDEREALTLPASVLQGQLVDVNIFLESVVTEFGQEFGQDGGCASRPIKLEHVNATEDSTQEAGSILVKITRLGCNHNSRSSTDNFFPSTKAGKYRADAYKLDFEFVAESDT